MAKGILHLHVTVVTLFLILLFVKTVLLLINSSALDKVREKTKILDMVLGTFILLTGGYLIYATSFETYILVKVVVTLVAIPLGIIGFKRKIKALALVSLLAFIYVYGVAETKSFKMKPDAISGETTEIFKSNCANCHGEDGKLGKAGAKDLTVTQLSEEEIAGIITNGKGLMPAYKKQLSPEQIQEMAQYVKSLKGN